MYLLYMLSFVNYEKIETNLQTHRKTTLAINFGSRELVPNERIRRTRVNFHVTNGPGTLSEFDKGRFK